MRALTPKEEVQAAIQKLAEAFLLRADLLRSNQPELAERISRKAFSGEYLVSGFEVALGGL